MKMDARVAGILSIRIIAGRKLKPMTPGSLLRWTSASANPYCRIQVDTQTFESSVVEESLQPSWGRDEHFDFPLRLPSESDDDLDLANHSTDPLLKHKLLDRCQPYQYQPQHPKIFLQVFHQNAPTLTEASALTLEKEFEVSESQNELMGEVVIDALPAIYSSASGIKDWHTILDAHGEDVGEILLAVQYDASGLDPCPGDVVRLTNFGGPKYYRKLCPPGQRLTTLDVRGDKVLATFRSRENWHIRLECHRNIVHVVHRPNLLLETQEKFAAKWKALRESRAARILPPNRRNQVLQGLALGQHIVKDSWHSGQKLFRWWQQEGIQSTVQCIIYEEVPHVWHSAVNQMYRQDWSGSSNPFDPAESGSRATTSSITTTVSNAHEGLVYPDELICPITGYCMVDPVVAADGHSYDREPIVKWLASNTMSPMTGLSMPTTQVFPNYALKKLSNELEAKFEQAQHAKTTSCEP